MKNFIYASPWLVLSALLYFKLSIHLAWFDLELVKESIAHFLG